MVTVMPGECERFRLTAVRGGGARPAVRRLSPPACRCRPGELASWLRLDIGADEAVALRAAARAAGVSVDAWLAVMVEFSASLDVLAAVLGSADRARERLSQVVDQRPVTVATLSGWRVWQGYLGRGATTGVDELPEVALPQRLIARGGGRIDVAAALANASAWSLARVCEVMACGRGQVLEAFVLEAGLAAPATGPG